MDLKAKTARVGVSRAMHFNYFVLTSPLRSVRRGAELYQVGDALSHVFTGDR